MRILVLTAVILSLAACQRAPDQFDLVCRQPPAEKIDPGPRPPASASAADRDAWWANTAATAAEEPTTTEPFTLSIDLVNRVWAEGPQTGTVILADQQTIRLGANDQTVLIDRSTGRFTRDFFGMESMGTCETAAFTPLPTPKF